MKYSKAAAVVAGSVIALGAAAAAPAFAAGPLDGASLLPDGSSLSGNTLGPTGLVRTAKAVLTTNRLSAKANGHRDVMSGPASPTLRQAMPLLGGLPLGA